jgi:hypothetical protein
VKTISIRLHWVARSQHDIALRSDDLQALFRTAFIELDLMPGEEIAQDPIYYPPPFYEDLVRHYAATDKEPGHLIIGLEPPLFDPGVAGQLLDPVERGVCIVYRRCKYILERGEVALLQTCAHELGHMLNLAHADVSPDFASAMDQADKRVKGEVGSCWEAAAREAHTIRQRNEPDYFMPLGRPLEALPFSHVARKTLNDLSGNRLTPWGGKFERPYDGTNDRSYA